MFDRLCPLLVLVYSRVEFCMRDEAPRTVTAICRALQEQIDQRAHLPAWQVGDLLGAADPLQGVHRLPASALVESPMLSVASTTPALVRELVHAGAGLPLIQCLDPAALMQRLQPSRGAAANADRSAAAVEREAAWDAQAA